MNRNEIRSRFDRVRRKGEMIVGAAVGAGVTARGAINAGADFLIALSAGRLRMMGAPSIASCFPVYNAGSFVEEFAAREFSTLTDKPILVGLSAMDPLSKTSDSLEWVVDHGFAGIANWPTTCTMPASYKTAMDLAGHGFQAELDLLRLAQDYDLFSCAFVDTPEQVELASMAGVDMINFVFGWTRGGMRGHTNVQTVSEACGLLKAAARRVKPSSQKTYFVTEGGPITHSNDLHDLFEHVTMDGYVGGSTFDRIAIEDGLKNSVIGFKDSHRKFRSLARKEDNRAKFAKSLSLTGTSNAIYETAGTLQSFVEAGVSPIALCGERGTEVEVVADRLSQMKCKPDEVAWIRCTEMTHEQWARRMFGRVNGGTPGLLGSAAVKHLVLVDCEALSRVMQDRLARVLTLGTYRPVGGPRIRHSPMAITIVQEQIDTLSEELREALHGKIVHVPPLRERTEDVPDILEAMFEKLPQMQSPTFGPSALHALRRHAWKRNMLDVNAFFQGLIKVRSSHELTEKDIETVLEETVQRDVSTYSDREIILKALYRNGFRKGRTAIQLGITRKTLYNRIKRHGIIS